MKYLSFDCGSKFSHQLDSLPNGIKELTLGFEHFSHPVYKLPESIKKIFVDNYEQKKLFDEKYHKIIDKLYIQSIHE
jgi:hypothetical protein